MAKTERAGRTRAGDEALIQAVYREHGRAMLAYATRLLGDRAAAEDVVQEALIRAWRHPEVLTNGKGSIRGWLLTVIRNLVTDRHRARASRPTEVADTDATPAVEPASAPTVATPIPVYCLTQDRPAESHLLATERPPELHPPATAPPSRSRRR